MSWVKAAAHLVGIAGKAGMLIPRYIVMRKKGVIAFEKELHRMGIRKEVVDMLSESYKDLGDVYKYVKKMKGR